MNTVLILTDSLAVWICFERGTAINAQVEALHVGKSAYVPCSWMQGQRTSVMLILDCERAEIEAYPLQRVGSLLSDRSNGNALRKCLIEQYPDAIISKPSKASQLDMLLVQHTHFSTNHYEWLAWVESSELFFDCVLTTSEALADLFASSTEPYLVVSNVLGGHRHTFCRSGYALFTRGFQSGESDSLQSLNETLVHLQSTNLIDSAVDVYLIGFHAGFSDSVANLDLVERVFRFEKLFEQTGEQAGEQAGGITSKQTGEKRGRRSSGKKNEQATCLTAEQSDAQLIHRLAAQLPSASVLPDESLNQYGSVIQIGRHALSQFGSRNAKSSRHVTLFLGKYTAMRGRRSYRMQLAAVIGLCILSVAYSATMTMENQARQRSLLEKRGQLALAIDQLKQELNSHSDVAEPLSHALLSALIIDSGIGVGPGVLLSVLGTAFGEHRSLALNELTWVSVDEADSVDQNVQADASRLLSLANTRAHLPVEGENASSVLVSIAGQSVSNTSLRAQQDAVNALVTHLQQQSGIVGVTVLESPLKQASQLHQGQSTASAPVFRIQFQIEKSTAHDV